MAKLYMKGSAVAGPDPVPIVKAGTPAAADERRDATRAYLTDLLDHSHPALREQARAALRAGNGAAGTPIVKAAKRAQADPQFRDALERQRACDPNPALREQARAILREAA
jgi:hypothetical protein